MNPVSPIFRDLSEIAAAMISLALISMLVVNSQGTSTVVGAVSKGFSGVLATATFQQNPFGNGFGSL